MASRRSSQLSYSRAGLRQQPSEPSGVRWAWLAGVDAPRADGLVVDDYDSAIAFFVEVLGFELVEDSQPTNDGRPKRWVVVRPPGARTAQALCAGRRGAARPRRWGISSPGGSGCSFAWTTSRRPTRG